MLVLDAMLELYRALPENLIIKTDRQNNIIGNKSPTFNEVMYFPRATLRDIIFKYIQESNSYKIDLRHHTNDNFLSGEIPKLPTGYYFAPTPSMREFKEFLQTIYQLQDYYYFYKYASNIISQVRNEFPL